MQAKRWKAGVRHGSHSSCWRRTGADLPWQDPRVWHGGRFEGWFWRFTGGGRVVVGLCALCRDARGTWGFAGIATDRHGFYRSAVLPEALADGARVTAAPVLDATPDRVRIEIGDALLDARLDDSAPVRALGVAHLVPGLPQYWLPHALGVAAEGTLTVGGERIAVRRAYAEKNWSRAFPRHWWWGSAHDFDGGEDLCVAFAGGALLPGLTPTAVIVRAGDRVRAAGPGHGRLVRAAVGDGTWSVRGAGVEITGRADPATAHALTVPDPGARLERSGPRQHLRGRLRVRTADGIDAVSSVAGLERGILR